MRARFAEAPDRERLTSAPLHGVIRDYPEVLAPLREMGVDVEGKGAAPLPEAGSEGERLVRAVLEATGWRSR